jgi:hypothetical protein
MAFGKVTIRLESGEVTEYELTKPTTSIGRQPGNDIVLNTSAVSRYHAQLDVSEGRVFLVDLGTVNGTFVNDRQLEPEGRVPLSDGDTVAVGDVMLVFSSPEAPGRAAVSLTPTPDAIEAPDCPFRLILDTPQQSVAPGARLQLVLLVENVLTSEQTLTVEIGGLDEDWVTLNRREMLLAGFERTEATISVRPPRSSQTRPGRYALTVRVASAADPALALSGVREIDVVGYAGLGMDVRPGRQDGAYRIAVQNQGNMPAEVRLEGFDREHALAFQFSPARLALDPGETAQVSLQVRPRRRGRAGRPVRFAVLARSLDAASYLAPVEADYVQPTSWLPWLAGAAIPIAFGSLLLIAALLIGLVYFGILRIPGLFPALSPQPGAASPAAVAPSPTAGPPPTLIPTPVAVIASFEVSPQQAIYSTGGVLLFTWQAAGVHDVTLSDETGALLPLSAADKSTGRFSLPVSGLARGEHTFTLTVTGADGQPVSRSVSASIVSVVCTLPQDLNVVIYTRPDPASPPGPPPLAPQVLINGRTDDAQWVQVAYNDLENLTIQGWLPAVQVSCPIDSVPLEDYVVIAASSAPPPVPSPTPPVVTSTPEATKSAP